MVNNGPVTCVSSFLTAHQHIKGHFGPLRLLRWLVATDIGRPHPFLPDGETPCAIGIGLSETFDYQASHANPAMSQLQWWAAGWTVSAPLTGRSAAVTCHVKLPLVWLYRAERQTSLVLWIVFQWLGTAAGQWKVMATLGPMLISSMGLPFTFILEVTKNGTAQKIRLKYTSYLCLVTKLPSKYFKGTMC